MGYCLVFLLVLFAGFVCPCDASPEYKVEVMAYVDQEAVDVFTNFGYSAGEVESKMTAEIRYHFNEANQMYASLKRNGLDIQLLIVGIQFMHRNLQPDVNPVHGSQLLKAMERMEDSKPVVQYDAAILFTGKDITGTTPSTAGMTTWDNICDKGKAAVMVAEISGLATTADVLAHEIGHGLGASHDDECSGDAGNVMASTGGASGARRFSFSSCSANEIMTHLRSSGNCLLKRNWLKTYTPTLGPDSSLLDITNITKVCKERESPYMGECKYYVHECDYAKCESTRGCRRIPSASGMTCRKPSGENNGKCTLGVCV